MMVWAGCNPQPSRFFFGLQLAACAWTPALITISILAPSFYSQRAPSNASYDDNESSWEGLCPPGDRRSNEVPESVRGFSPSHTATAKISRLRQLYAVLVFQFFFNFLPQTSFRTLMTKLHLHRTIRISFLGLASIHFHCILGSTQQLRIR